MLILTGGGTFSLPTESNPRRGADWANCDIVSLGCLGEAYREAGKISRGRPGPAPDYFNFFVVFGPAYFIGSLPRGPFWQGSLGKSMRQMCGKCTCTCAFCARNAHAHMHFHVFLAGCFSGFPVVSKQFSLVLDLAIDPCAGPQT